MEKEVLEGSLKALEMWAIGFGVLVAIGVAGESVIGFMIWGRHSRLQAIQTSENLQQQQQIEQLRKDAASAIEAAAEANRKAEEERLERVKIQERLAPRRLSAEQQERLTTALRPFAGQKLNVFTDASDAEAVQFSPDLIAALRRAGWVLFESVGHETTGRAVPGMLVEFKADASQGDLSAGQALVNALLHERLAVSGPVPRWTGGRMTSGNINEDLNNQLWITIGPKL